MSRSANFNHWTDFIVYFVTNIYYYASGQAQYYIGFNCFPLEEFNMTDLDKTRDELSAELGELRRRLADSEAEARRLVDAEKALRASEQKFRLIAELTHDWRYWVAPDGSLKHVSASCEGITGYSPDEFLDNPALVEEIVYPDDRCIVSEHSSSAGQFETHQPIEFRVITANGQERWLEHSCQPVFGENGEFLGRIANNKDITKRKLAEENLKLSNVRLSLALEAAKSGTWDWDLRTDRIDWSDELWDLYSLEPHSCESSYDTWLMTVHPDDRARMDILIKECVSNAAELEVEWRVANIADKDRWLFGRGKPVFDSTGHAVRYIGVVIDITDRKKTERDLLRYRDNLERLVQQRTSQLYESRDLLRMIIHNLPVAIYYQDPDERYLISNRTHQKWWARSAAQIEGFTAQEVMGEEYASAPGNFNATRGQQVNIETTMKYADGVTRDILVNVIPHKGPKGSVKGVFGFITDITEIKKSQNKLIESEMTFRSLFENSLDGILLAAPDGRIFMANPTACEILGMTEQEICAVGREGIYDTTDPRYTWAIQEREKNGEVRTEINLKSRDGKVVPVELTSRIFRYSETELRSIGIFRDISERKLMEETLRESEQTLNRILTASDIGIVFVNPDRTLRWANRAWFELFGYEADDDVADLQVKSFYQSAEEFDRVGRLISYFCHQGEPAATDTIYIRKNGETFDAHVRVNPFDPTDLTKGFVSTVQDISARKKAERELQASKAQFEAFMENSPLCAFIKDESGRYLYANKSWPLLFNPIAKDWHGKTATELFPGGVSEKFTESDRETLKRGEVSEFIQEVPDSSGQQHTWLTYKFPIRDSLGRRLLGGVALDISEQKKYEQEKEALQNRLFESQKMESLGTLVGGIAHDFNNMLQIIVGYAQLHLDATKLPEPVYDDLQTIIRTSMEGAELVRKLLAFGQQAQTIPTEIDLNDRIRELATLMSRTLPHVIGLNLDLTDRPTVILADPGEIGQLVMNLAINASEAMPEGGDLKILTSIVTLDDNYCKSHPEAKPGDYVMLCVKDTGRGMDEDTKSRIFDPFFSTKQRGSTRGTGLGLSVVRGIVQQRGGHTTCESVPGKGTEFKVYFPVVESVSQATQHIDSQVQPVETKIILVVEDNIAVAQLEKRGLENAGYKVIVARNGKEAIDLFQTRSDQIALVILDLIMPEMSGRDCLMGLVKIDPAVRVLIASGYSPEDELNREITPLVKGFVHKPFAITELINAVQSALGNA